VAPNSTVREIILYSFHGRPSGWNPDAGLIFDRSGALYGTTLIGGECRESYYGCGTVFTLGPAGSGYSESILYRFQGASDGAAPSAGLALGPHRQLFGTTSSGGAYDAGIAYERPASAVKRCSLRGRSDQLSAR
jgi:hypothetical protein